MKYARIRNLREDHDLTQNQLAGFLHVSQTTYSAYECGKSNIPNEILVKLAFFYHTSIDYLLGLTDDPRKPSEKTNPADKKTSE